MSGIDGLLQRINSVSAVKIHGHVRSIVGISMLAGGLDRAAGIGGHCRVFGRFGPVMAEIVGIQADGLILLPFGSWDGVAAGDRVELVSDAPLVTPDDSWIGAVVDALGNPISKTARKVATRNGRRSKDGAPSPFARRRVGEKMATGVKSLDVFVPLCRGQRLGIFSGSGVGKSTLMAMLARNAQADVIVVGLVGERGRELNDFIEEGLGPDGMARTVVVAATGDEAPLMRRQAAWTAMTVAEHFRAQGKHVLLLLDSVTRFAMAQREIGLSSGEPPTAKGYPPTVFSELPKLLERAGPGQHGEGDITAVFTVLVEGDDMNEPIADAIRGIVDGHLVMSRRIAEQGRFPAVDIQRSISRMLPECHSEEEIRIMNAARLLLARYTDMEDLIRVGAYRAGTDAEVDSAIRFFDRANTFLSQRKSEVITPQDSFTELYRILLEAGGVDPLADLLGEMPSQNAATSNSAETVSNPA